MMMGVFSLQPSILLQLVVSLVVAATALSSVTITTGGQLENLRGHDEVQKFLPDAEDKSYCKMEVITQVVTHLNCEDQEIENQVCIGQCLSYSFPQTEPDTEEVPHYCESCQPSETAWRNLTMDCSKNGEKYEVELQVQQIMNCSCTECQIKSHPSHHSRDEDVVLPLILPENREVENSLGLGPEVSPEQETSDNDLRGPTYRKAISPSDILLNEEILFTPKGGKDPNLIDIARASNSTTTDLLSLISSLQNVDHSNLSLSEINGLVKNNKKNKTESIDHIVDNEQEKLHLDLPIDEVEIPK